MDAIHASGVDFDFPCGGRGRCGKCRVSVLSLPPVPTEADRKFLSERELQAGVRLACATIVAGDMEVQLYEEKKPEYKILLAAEERNIDLEPIVKKISVDVIQPTLHDQSSDWKRLRESLALKTGKSSDLKVQLPVITELHSTVRDSDYKVTVVVENDEVLGVEGGDTSGTLYGMAFDIGTTTVVGYLTNLLTGEEVAIASTLNPQTKFGADVITRTNFANSEENGLEMLHNTVVEAIDRLVGEACDQAGVKKTDVYEITVCGNTCMHHLFAGLNPKHIALAPYVPVNSDPISVNAVNFGININPAGKVFMFPCIAGFVGGDTVAVILSTELDRSNDIKLAVDIGTNGEIVLGSKKRMVSCSTAAGPAFEGAQLSSGMRGAIGAIDHVKFEGTFEYTVIGGGKPEGICGSGLLDVIAGLITHGIVDKAGKILAPEKVKNPTAQPYLKQIIKYNNANAFVLADENTSSHGRPIMITQGDIRELQLAKGALATGIATLMEVLDVGYDDIKEVLLAGAFGNYMAPHSACVVGLLPKELESKIKMVGNAAGSGSKLALLSATEYHRTGGISGSVDYVELGAYPKFYDMFINSLNFR